MSSKVSSGLPDVERVDGTAEDAGFVVLGLAQLVCIFAFWLALWPTAFGLPRGSSLGTTLGATFALGAAVGFYLAFQYLSISG